jgi:hypothetical protein
MKRKRIYLILHILQRLCKIFVIYTNMNINCFLERTTVMEIYGSTRGRKKERKKKEKRNVTQT